MINSEISDQRKIPLISVIVPVFQVEKYLDQCITSILNQTYHNLEIILIDDGSTDNSPATCDKYQKEDNRIKVIHKKNGGLSQARNTGFRLSTGDYIGFVDSDDWIENNMYKVMLADLMNSKADIAVCNYHNMHENGKAVQSIVESSEKKQYTSEEALRMIINSEGYIKSFVWNKLYKRSLLSDISFPEGKIYEDTIWTAKIIGKARLVTLINYPLYHYRYRCESLSHNDLQIARRTIDLIEMYELRIEYLQNFFPALIKIAINNFQNLCCFEYIRIYMDKLDTDGKICSELYRHCCKFGIRSIWDLADFKMSFVRMLFVFCPSLLLSIYKIYKKVFALREKCFSIPCSFNS